jgi:hypothetical protein
VQPRKWAADPLENSPTHPRRTSFITSFFTSRAHHSVDMEQQITLNHEASANDSNKQATTTLPPEVAQCLENARFVSSHDIIRSNTT